MVVMVIIIILIIIIIILIIIIITISRTCSRPALRAEQSPARRAEQLDLGLEGLLRILLGGCY